MTKHDNPMGTNGFEFVEFASSDPEGMRTLFEKLGFTAIAKHRSKEVILYRQSKINFILNNEPNSYAIAFGKQHGPCACAVAFRVKDANAALERAVALGAKPYLDGKIGKGERMIPAIYGIGGSLLYLVDDHQDKSIYDTDFIPLKGVHQYPEGYGLLEIDHLTHNVHQGEMDKWTKDFYEKIFNFYEIRYFDIEGQKTGLTSRALSSPCGKIKISIKQSKDDVSQIEESLKEYKGKGIDHIALNTNNIYHTVEDLREAGINFLTVPDTYYEMIDERIGNHHEAVERMRKNQILIDGEVKDDKVELLLQIFTQNIIGPLFFEIIQRKGNEGFGEGNFTALFKAIERDQIRRSVLCSHFINV